MRRVTLSIPGEPKGKGRARAMPGINAEGDAFVRMITPSDTREEEARIRALFRAKYPDLKPWAGPIEIRFTAVFETPKSFNRALREAAARGKLYCTKKPDKDNIEKLVCDALNHVLFVDDAQVMGGGIKRYGSPARIDVSFERLDCPDIPATPGQKRAERAQQAELPLPTQRPGSSNLHKSQRPEPDLSAYRPDVQERIRAALARERGGV